MTYDPNPQQPYQSYGSPPPPQRGSGMKIVWILLGVFGVLGLVCCGGCGLFSYFSMNAGADVIAKQLQSQPIMQQHIGNVETATMNLSAAVGEAQKYPAEKSLMVLDVKGSKGDGQLIIATTAAGDPTIKWAKLRIPSGQEFDVVGGGFDDFDDF